MIPKYKFLYLVLEMCIDILRAVDKAEFKFKVKLED